MLFKHNHNLRYKSTVYSKEKRKKERVYNVTHVQNVKNEIYKIPKKANTQKRRNSCSVGIVDTVKSCDEEICHV